MKNLWLLFIIANFKWNTSCRKDWIENKEFCQQVPRSKKQRVIRLVDSFSQKAFAAARLEPRAFSSDCWLWASLRSNLKRHKIFLRILFEFVVHLPRVLKTIKTSYHPLFGKIQNPQQNDHSKALKWRFAIKKIFCHYQYSSPRP